MNTTMIALSAAALIAAAPVLAQNASSKAPHTHHHVSRQHHRGLSGYAKWDPVHANGLKTTYPGAFGYAPSEPRDPTLESSRQAGGGGGGGGGM